MADEIDSRMEQIRIKNEELEKKHKEILEDELEARKQNAIVSLKESAGIVESKHRYDDLELDFDVQADQKQHSKNPDYKPKNSRKPVDKKQLDEIPPDPVNFLRDDADSEGNKKNVDPRPQLQQQQHQQNNNNRNNRRNPRPPRSNNQGDVPAYGNNSDGRPRFQNNPRPRLPPPQQSNRGAYDNSNGSNTQNSSSPRKIYPQALRTERRTMATDGSNQAGSEEPAKDEKSPTATSRPRRPIQKQQQRPIHKDGERNNLTVNLTDEVRSVKIKPTERVGSGRVGHGNGIQADDLESPEKPHSGDRNKNRNPRNKRNYKPKAQPTPEFQHPILDKIVITKTSVQERLLRIMSDDAGVVPAEPKIATDSSPEIIEGSK